MQIINFLLYGNVFIAICAYAQAVLTFYILKESNPFSSILTFFIALATFFLYNIHKPITYLLKKQVIDNQRFAKTKSFSTPLSILTILVGLACAILFFYLQRGVQICLVVAALFSFSYVLPIFRGKRLRDFPFVKIFTIAIVWAMVCVVLPVLETERRIDLPIFLIILEKTLFVFAITIPFDIRDMDWDAKTEVKTIPLSIGLKNAKILSVISLMACILMSFVVYKNAIYNKADFIALTLSYLLSIGLVWRTQKSRNDYFFYGLIDGLLLFQAMLLILMHDIY